MATLKAEMNLDFRRGSELNTGSHGLPKMTMDDFKLLVVLGKGSFGKVWHTRAYMYMYYMIQCA